MIVGDNGAGKTSLLEGLFLALGHTSELGVRYRGQRGLEGHFSGPIRQIEEALWRDYFYNRDWNRAIYVETTGDGPEARSVRIARGAAQLSIPLVGSDKAESLAGSITITWRDSKNREQTVTPKVSRGNLEFPATEEDLPDFFYFSATHMPTSTENATRFSELSRARRTLEFTKVFISEYSWIEDLAIEVTAGAPVVYATVKGKKDKFPLPNVSGGINRIIGIMLAIAAQSGRVVLVDEMENGVYHTHHEALWRSILDMSDDYQTQLFVTTHSEEWLKSMAAASKGFEEQIAVWRVERNESGQPTIYQFEGERLIDAIKRGADPRGLGA